jgi:hypothetical protein
MNELFADFVFYYTMIVFKDKTTLFLFLLGFFNLHFINEHINQQNVGKYDFKVFYFLFYFFEISF